MITSHWRLAVIKTKHYLTSSSFIWAVLLTLALFLSANSTSAQGESEITIHHSDEKGLNFRLRTSPLQSAAGGRIVVQGLAHTFSEPGTPELPYYSTFIALPPAAEVAISVEASGLTTYPEMIVPPVPQRRLSGPVEAGDLTAIEPQHISEPLPLFVENEAIYSRDTLFPAVLYEISQPQYLRDLRLVQLKLFPLRYNPQGKSVTQAAQLDVKITFSGANFNDRQPSPGFVDNKAQALRQQVLNFDQAHSWRSLPPLAAQAEDMRLPLGTQTFKILVDEDGIYEISGAELAAQGLALPVAEPTTMQLMQRGQPVAFQFIDDNNNGQFDAADKIRFYGWAFDGSRYEQMYANDNVFWFWVGGTAQSVPLVANQAGSGSPVTSFQESISRQDENENFSGWALTWENEPTVWHWDRIISASTDFVSQSYDIDLPDPVPGAAGNTILVELTTKLNPFTSLLPNYTARTYLNGSQTFGEANWFSRHNLNIAQAFPASDFKQPGDVGYPTNQVAVAITNDVGNRPVLLTRISANYTRALKTVDDQLIFTQKDAGQHDFLVSGFSSGDPAEKIVWDISERQMPRQIAVQAEHISGSGTGYTLAIGRQHAANARFIATTSANMKAVKQISAYVPPSLDPPDGHGQWLAITHSSLSPAANSLAAHRQAEFSTWVVDIEDVNNQVGYGFATPTAIRDFLTHAVYNWQTGPDYVALFGDATRNPMQQECPLCDSWDSSSPTLIVTDFSFTDRWNGMIPTDFSLTLLFGDDLLADTTIGRFPANTLQEAQNMVDKVILYETDRQAGQEAWHDHFLFVSDNKDLAGDFCAESQRTAAAIPSSPYTQTHLCLPDATAQDTDDLRAAMSEQINVQGATVLNYRGHGAYNAWASGPPLLLATDTDFWQNNDRPLFILSADCLDGYFIQTHDSGLGESFYRLQNRGSAAHWSSSGLGLNAEHTILHSAFYEGVFDYKLKRLGDAINYAKMRYWLEDRYISELYSFILLGDPAMIFLNPEQAGSEDFQTIMLDPGWHTISSYVDPLNPALANIIPDQDVKMCKDGNGFVYWPEMGVDTIGNWKIGDAYQCFANSSTTIALAGGDIKPQQTPLDLLQGWNLVAYLREYPMGPEQALSSIVEHLIMAKDNYGQIYWPEYGVNQIGEMEPGQGYNLYLSDPVTLTYPSD